MTLAEAYTLLDLPFGASNKDAQEAADLHALAWHPDRFGQGKRREIAAKRTRRINEAFDLIRSTPRPHVQIAKRKASPNPTTREQKSSPRPNPERPIDCSQVDWLIKFQIVAYAIATVTGLVLAVWLLIANLAS